MAMPPHHQMTDALTRLPDREDRLVYAGQFLDDALRAGALDGQAAARLRAEVDRRLAVLHAGWAPPSEPPLVPAEAPAGLAASPAPAPRESVAAGERSGASRLWEVVASEVAVHGLASLGVGLLIAATFGFVVFAFAGVNAIAKPVAEIAIPAVLLVAARLLRGRGAPLVSAGLELAGGAVLPVVAFAALADGSPFPPDVGGVARPVAWAVVAALVALAYVVVVRRRPDSALRALVGPAAWVGVGCVAAAVAGWPTATVPAAVAVAVAGTSLVIGARRGALADATVTAGVVVLGLSSLAVVVLTLVEGPSVLPPLVTAAAVAGGALVRHRRGDVGLDAAVLSGLVAAAVAVLLAAPSGGPLVLVAAVATAVVALERAASAGASGGVLGWLAAAGLVALLGLSSEPEAAAAAWAGVAVWGHARCWRPLSAAVDAPPPVPAAPPGDAASPPSAPSEGVASSSSAPPPAPSEGAAAALSVPPPARRTPGAVVASVAVTAAVIGPIAAAVAAAAVAPSAAVVLVALAAAVGLRLAPALRREPAGVLHAYIVAAPLAATLAWLAGLTELVLGTPFSTSQVDPDLALAAPALVAAVVTVGLWVIAPLAGPARVWTAVLPFASAVALAVDMAGLDAIAQVGVWSGVAGATVVAALVAHARGAVDRASAAHLTGLGQALAVALLIDPVEEAATLALVAWAVVWCALLAAPLRRAVPAGVALGLVVAAVHLAAGLIGAAEVTAFAAAAWAVVGAGALVRALGDLRAAIHVMPANPVAAADPAAATAPPDPAAAASEAPPANVASSAAWASAGTVLVLVAAGTAGDAWWPAALVGLTVALLLAATRTSAAAPRRALLLGGALAAVAAWAAVVDLWVSEPLTGWALTALVGGVVALGGAITARRAATVPLTETAAVVLGVASAGVAVAAAAARDLLPLPLATGPVPQAVAETGLTAAMAATATVVGLAAAAAGVGLASRPLRVPALRLVAVGLGLAAAAILADVRAVAEGTRVAAQMTSTVLATVAALAVWRRATIRGEGGAWAPPLAVLATVLALAGLAGAAALPSALPLVSALLVLAVQTAGAGLALRRVEPLLVTPVAVAAACLVALDGTGGAGVLGVSLPVGAALLAESELASWARRARPGGSMTFPVGAVDALEWAGLAVLTLPPLAQVVAGDLEAALVGVAVGAVLVLAGAVTRVRRRAAAGVVGGLGAVALAVLVPLLRLLPEVRGVWLWAALALLGGVLLVGATMLERGRSWASRALAQLAERTRDWT